MRTLKIIAFVFSSAFVLNCGVAPSSSDPTTDVEEQNVLRSCEELDGQRCARKGIFGMCDNGTPEQGFCVCAQHGASGFRLICA